MHAYFGLNVDTACPKLLHSPDMHEVVKPSLNRTEPSLNRNRKNLTAFLLGTLVASPVVLSSACGGARSVSPDPAVGSFAVSPAFNSAFNSAFSPGADTAADTRTPDLSSVGLQTRVEEYWQARIQGNTQRALQYEHPAYRDKLDEQAYRARTSRIAIRTFSIADPDSLQLPAEAQEASVGPYASNINTCSLSPVQNPCFYRPRSATVGKNSTASGTMTWPPEAWPDRKKRTEECTCGRVACYTLNKAKQAETCEASSS